MVLVSGDGAGFRLDCNAELIGLVGRERDEDDDEEEEEDEEEDVDEDVDE